MTTSRHISRPRRDPTVAIRHGTPEPTRITTSDVVLVEQVCDALRYLDECLLAFVTLDRGGDQLVGLSTR